MPVPDAETPPPADAPIAVDSTVPGLSITATVTLTGARVLDGGAVWVSCNGRTFSESFTGTIGASVERATAHYGLTGAARRSLSRTIGAAWRTGVDVHTAHRLYVSRACNASFAERFGSALALAPAPVAP